MTILLLFVLYALALSVALARAGYRSTGAQTKSEPVGQASRLLIVGATGGTGRQLVSQALERGFEVTALVRDPSKLRIEHQCLTVLQGDVLDEESLARAVHGKDAVLSALGHKRYFYPTRILSEGTRNLLRAMEAQGARRLVCMSSLGIGDSAGRMGLWYTLFVIPVILPFYFWDKTRQERIVAASNSDWTIVRPGALTNGGKAGRVRQGAHIGSFILTVRVSRADVADFMLDVVTAGAHVRSAVSIA